MQVLFTHSKVGISGVRLFHRRALATAKLLSTKVLCVRGSGGRTAHTLSRPSKSRIGDAEACVLSQIP